MLSFSSIPGRKPLPRLKRRKYKAPADLLHHDDAKWAGRCVVQMHPPSCAIMRGHEACDCNAPREVAQNVLLNGGAQSVLDHLVDATATTKGFVTHFEVGLSPTAPLAAQTGTLLPKARKEARQATRSSNTAIFKTFFNGSQANTNQGAVSIGTSTTLFTLQSGQGALFAIGQQIRVTVGVTPYTTTIQNIATDTLTVSPALGAIPTGGSVVEQLLSELVLYGDASATDTIGTGVAYARTVSFTPRTKAVGFGMTAEWHISLT